MNRKIKLLSFIGLLIISTGTALAQTKGYYQTVGRSNDPFVFCTKGEPNHGWVPVNPLSGTWRCKRRKCRGLNTMWIPTYTSICPKALSMGGWNGPGRGEDYKAGIPDKLIPYKH